jgi:tetratricopeptide (TPR) repeat protein
MLTSPGEYCAYLCAVRAEIEFALGRFQDAALSYFSVTISDPDDSDAHYNLALSLEHCGRWDVAAEAFQRVLQLDGEREDARLGLGACLLHLNRAEEALAIFTQCGPGFDPTPALIGKAVALQLLRRFEEARMEYSALLASDPNSEEALSNLIAMGIETGDLKRVWDHSIRLLDISPHSTVALQGLATVAFGGSDYSAAASYCNRILELAPDSLEAWHNFRIAMDQSSFSSSELAVSFRTGGKQ